jgi:hypothetical protein
VAKDVCYLTCSGSIKVEGYPFFIIGLVIDLCSVTLGGVFYSILYSCI